MSRWLVLPLVLSLVLTNLLSAVAPARAQETAPVEEICGNAVDNDGDTEVDEGCETPPPTAEVSITADCELYRVSVSSVDPTRIVASRVNGEEFTGEFSRPIGLGETIDVLVEVVFDDGSVVSKTETVSAPAECAPAATETPVPTSTETPTAVPTNTPTPIATATRTSTSTVLPTESSTVNATTTARRDTRVGASAALSASVLLSHVTGKVGTTTIASLAGFRPNEAVAIRWYNGTTVVEVKTGTTDVVGTALLKFRVPAALIGAHKVEVKGTRSRATSTYTVVPRVALATYSAPAGATLAVSLRGFGAREALELRWYEGSRFTVMARVTTTSATGSVNTSFVIPRRASAGRHKLEAIRVGGSRGATTVTVTSGAATATATSTATPTPTATRTPVLETYFGTWHILPVGSNSDGALVRMSLSDGSVGEIVGEVALANGCHFDFTLVAETVTAAEFSTQLKLGQCGATPYRSTVRLLSDGTLRWETYRPDDSLETYSILTRDELTSLPGAFIGSWELMSGPEADAFVVGTFSLRAGGIRSIVGSLESLTSQCGGTLTLLEISDDSSTLRLDLTRNESGCADPQTAIMRPVGDGTLRWQWYVNATTPGTELIVRRTSKAATIEYFALGDSVASGHGLMDDRSPCRRSTRAYPYKVEQGLERQGYVINLHHYACSGAKTQALDESDPDLRPKLFANQVQDVVLALRDIPSDRPVLVSITIGANDFGWLSPLDGLPRFAGFYEYELPGSYDRWLNERAELVYQQLRYAVQTLLTYDNVRIVLTSYGNPLNPENPVLANEGHCTLLEVRSCYERVDQFIKRLEQGVVLDTYVALGRPRDRVRLTGALRESFRGHEGAGGELISVCGSAPPGIDETWIQWPGDPFSNSIMKNGVNLGGDCFHPNEAGAQQYADHVVAAALPILPTSRVIAGARPAVATAENDSVWAYAPVSSFAGIGAPLVMRPFSRGRDFSFPAGPKGPADRTRHRRCRRVSFPRVSRRTSYPMLHGSRVCSRRWGALPLPAMLKLLHLLNRLLCPVGVY